MALRPASGSTSMTARSGTYRTRKTTARVYRALADGRRFSCRLSRGGPESWRLRCMGGSPSAVGIDPAPSQSMRATRQPVRARSAGTSSRWFRAGGERRFKSEWLVIAWNTVGGAACTTICSALADPTRCGVGGRFIRGAARPCVAVLRTERRQRREPISLRLRLPSQRRPELVSALPLTSRRSVRRGLARQRSR